MTRQRVVQDKPRGGLVRSLVRIGTFAFFIATVFGCLSIIAGMACLVLAIDGPIKAVPISNWYWWRFIGVGMILLSSAVYVFCEEFLKEFDTTYREIVIALTITLLVGVAVFVYELFAPSMGNATSASALTTSVMYVILSFGIMAAFEFARRNPPRGTQ